ncbi:MAG: hypothetical protein ACFE0O_04985 [Opitutales bacterium]
MSVTTSPPTTAVEPVSDERTGRPVFPISNPAAPAEAPYFEARGFTADERYLVFRSESGGSSELYRFELATGETVQLTQGMSVGHHSQCMAPDGRWLYFIVRDTLWRIDVPAAGKPEPVFGYTGRGPGELWPFPVSFSQDGSRVALAAKESATGEPIPYSATGAKQRPTHLWILDLPGGEASKVLSWKNGFSHPMICPADPDFITFVQHGENCWNMEAPPEGRVRTWSVRVGEGVARPFLTPLLNRTITHESWSPDGERLFFFDKQYPKWCPVSVCSINRAGGDWQCHYTSYEYALGHGVVSPDGTRFISDCQKAGDSPLIEIDLKTGRGTVLCWPDTSQEGGHAKAAHCHPSYSPSGRWILYTSDKSGTPRVFLTPSSQQA